MHTGGSSPFNKKEWVIKEWPMCNRAITVSSFLVVRGQNTKKKKKKLTLGISYIIYFPGTHPTQTATVPIYIYLCVILDLRIWWAQPRSMLYWFLCKEFLLYFPYCFRVFFVFFSRFFPFLTHPMLAFLYCGEFLLHIPCWLHFYRGSFS